jgi:hypothetical protein
LTALLLSYPRSGNHLLRFVAEYITGRPSLGCMHNPQDIPIFRNTFPKPVLSHVQPDAEPVFRKSHGFPECVRFNNLPLVFILRDFRECVTRQVLNQKSPGLLKRLTFQAHNPPRPERYFACLTNYLEVLRIYDGWQQPKHLIRYEDLITDIASTVRDLGDFLNWNSERVADFIANKDELFQLSLQGEGRSWAGSATKGESTRYHYSNADPDMLTKMAEHIELFHHDLVPHLHDYGIVVRESAPRPGDAHAG